MGFFSDIGKRVETFWKKDKDAQATKLARGNTFKKSGYGGSAGFGYGADVCSDLAVETDLLARYADYEEMDDYPEIACLSIDSRVGILGKGEHGIEYTPISELLSRRELYPEVQMYTLAVDVAAKCLVPVEFKGPILSGKNQPVFKVTFEQYHAGRGKKKLRWSLRVTANHPFMLRDGSYKTAAELVPGVRLMPASVRTASNGYPQVRDLFVTGNKGAPVWHNLHSLVAKSLDRAPEAHEVVHHEDGDKQNLHPSNLKIESRALHTQIHAITKRPEVREQLSNFSKKRWADPVQACAWAASQRKNNGEVSPHTSSNPTPKGILSDAHRKAIAEGHTIPLARDIVENALRTSPSMSEAARKLKVSWDTLGRRMGQFGFPSEMIGTSLQTVTQDQPGYDNHVVVSVEPDGFDDVYDIEVPIYKNFIAEGVFVHNTALDIFADDSTQLDSQLNRTVWVTSKDESLQRILTDMLHKRLRIDEEIWEISRSLCILEGSLVWTSKGPVPIEEVKEGDWVQGHKDGEQTLVRVKKVWCTGEKDVWRVATKHRELFVTAKHPVLVQNDDGSTEFVKVEDLKVRRHPGGAIDRTSSKVVISTSAPEPAEIPSWDQLFESGPTDRPWGNKGTPTKLKLPEQPTPWMCRLLGFMLGDGFLGNEDLESSSTLIAYSRGEHEELNEYYDELLVKLGLNPKENVDRQRTEVHSTQFKEFLLRLGWKNGASLKRLPKWVGQLTRDLREEYVRGFWDADGWSSTRPTWRREALSFEIANIPLAYDLKALIDGLGYRSGNLSFRHRKPGFKIKGVAVKTTQPTAMLTWSDFRYESGFRSECVVKIEKHDTARVWDMEVDSEEHSMTVSGVVTHNCKYGNDFEELLVTNEGVVGLNFLPASTTRRVEDCFGALKGFIQSRDGKIGFSTEEFDELLCQRNDEINNCESNDYAPQAVALEDWEVVHFRLRSKHRRSVYGYSVLEPARWIWKRLMMMEDAAILFRLQKAMERYAFYVDVGDMPPAEALAYVNRVRQQYRKKRFVNPNSGKLELQFNPGSPDDDFWVPTRQGRDATRIDVVGSPQWQCLVGDTRVPLLDGSSPTIEELSKRTDAFWLYSIDSKGRVVPGKGRAARQTHEAAEIWEVELDNGEKVRCTSNHPFLTRDGKWSLAEHLLPGDSLMPLYRKESSHNSGDKVGGYEKVYDPASNEWIYTHHRVFEETTETDLSEFFRHGNVIHHADYKKQNNAPENLAGMTRPAHTALHMEHTENLKWSPQKHVKHRAMMIERMSDKVLRADKARILADWNRSPERRESVLGEKHPRWNTLDVAGLEYLVLATGARGVHELMEKGRVGQSTIGRVLKAEGITWNQFAQKNIPGWEAKGRALHVTNHKVVSVRKTGEKLPVFDLTVEKHANFATGSGVFVSNSMDDIEYFRDKLFAGLKVPKSYLAQEQEVARATLSSQDVRFARSVLRVQRELKTGIGKICRVHLAALGIDPAKAEFEIHMTVPSAIFELAQLEVRSARADLAARLADFVSLRWTLENILGLSDKEIVIVMKEKQGDIVRGLEAQGQGEAAAATLMNEVPVQEESLSVVGGEPQTVGELGQRVQHRSSKMRLNSGPISEKELSVRYDQAEKRAEAKIDQLLRSDVVFAKRLREVRSLLEDIRTVQGSGQRSPIEKS